MTEDQRLRKQIGELLRSAHAHATFDKVVEGFPLDRIGIRPQSMPHSAWELLEHMRLAQHDILRFSASKEYEEMKWPEDYWPATPAPENPGQWTESAKAYHADLTAFEKLLNDPERDLYQPFPWGDGQTLLREALLIADHNAYHLGQLLLVRRAVGAWD